MTQTAVEWLVDKFMTENTTREGWHEIFEQAKEMEKKQLIEAMNRMGNTDFYCEYEDPEQYYNETFKSK